MNDTPRLRSAFPSTPGTGQKSREQNASASGSWSYRAPLPDLVSSRSDAAEPVIPFSVIDAPSQRLYVSFFYLGLTVWRLADFFRLVSDETDSLWLFMKWVAIDGFFLYGLPGLKVPWLQWSSSTITLLFVGHAILNAVLMFRIPIPIESWLLAVTKLFYDREIAIAERHVKPASILQNSSLILGKQIIHILPEGSAMLNPDQVPFCIGGAGNIVNLPIRVNQTSPILIELLRIDLATNMNETISITGKALRRLKKQANKSLAKNDDSSPRFLQLPVKESGLYRLQKVVDESKLEVQRRLSDTLVVQCPSASVKSVQRHKCKGDLSDFYFEVLATPPFKIKYSKTVNREDNGHVLLSMHPDNLISPLARQNTSGVLVSQDPASVDVSWARAQPVKVPVNESLGTSGNWHYLIDEIQDACGNIVNYSSARGQELTTQKSKGGNQLEQMFTVHGRPMVSVDGYSSQHSLKVQKGKSRRLPIRINSVDTDQPETSPHTLSYFFTPQDSLLPNQEQPKDAVFKKVDIHGNHRGFEVSEPGLYTLHSINNEYCAGEILEPSACLLQNPPQPDLHLTTETIPDRCAGNSIGLLVDLDLIGTPPIRISYNVHREGQTITPQVVTSDRLQKQLELRPVHAGHYLYEFAEISDAIYKDPRSLASRKLFLEQDVKPSASARFLQARPLKMACIDHPVSFDVEISGEGPWTLEYEIVHNGQRRKAETKDIQESLYVLQTESLKTGGEYSLMLKSITDKSGCKVLLDQVAKIEVGLQKPKASFGQLEGKRSISALEGKAINLPLRLQGEPPWIVTYENLDEQEKTLPVKLKQTFLHDNDQLEIKKAGTYEITNVQDASCPGSVDLSANQFVVRWIPRPTLSIVESSLVELVDGKYVKQGICEGDEDSTQISFSGTAPYAVEYNQNFKPDHGSMSKRVQKIAAGNSLTSFKMASGEPGLYEYEFFKLGDSSYSPDYPAHRFLIVQQRVHSKPSARFTDVGKTYKYCKEEETGDEVIPITLTGAPPFYLEIDIRHHATSKPEIINIPHIDKKQYNFRLPHRVLGSGTHAVTIRKIRDSRGCQKKMDVDGPNVQVSVADIPSISPLETQTDFCVGDRISYTLSGSPPFKVFYTFQDRERMASIPTTTFRRIAEKPGEFKITSISDQKSTDDCRARVEIMKTIHEMPSVRISKGRTATVDIHEGSEAEILFEFGGTPPFEFTYTRSTNPPKGKKSEVLETRNEVSYEYVKTIRASDEGIYEVVSIKDKFCAFSTQKAQGKAGHKLLTYR